MTVAAAKIASSQEIRDYGLHPRAGYNVALVLVRVKNAARYPACAYPDVWLVVKEGYVYPGIIGFNLKALDLNRLLPTDETSGVFAFEVKAATEPSSLKLVRGAIAEDMCASFQHRETQISGPESVTLSLSGIPATIPPSAAAATQPSPRQAPPPTAAPEIPTPPSPLVSFPVLSDARPAQTDAERKITPVTIQSDGTPVFRAGENGIGYPSCLYCPEPQFSEDARKAKIQGIVVLQAVITAAGRAEQIEVVKALGHGLDEKAVEAVRSWRFKPAIGPNGNPVATVTSPTITFRLVQ